MPVDLVGRDDQLGSIREFFDEPGALLVTGEAGVGKSAVLDEFAAGAAGRGTRVLRAAGVLVEAEVGYSTLHQLLFPLGEDMSMLGDVHRSALRCALGYEAGAAPERLVVSTAALLWLRAAAAETSLLLVVDDVHWVDRASAEVLSFVARRLVGSPIVFLAACRSAEPGFFRHSGLTEMVLPPLSACAARTLVDRHFPELAPAVRQRVLTEAAGNPLSLMELPSALCADQRADFTTLPEVLPLSDRLRGLFTARVRALPWRCRLMMLIGVLGGTTEIARLRAAGGGVCDVDDLRPAEEARLVRVSATRLDFRHPLVRAAVVEVCSERERRWAHGALAEVVDSRDLCVRHLGQAAIGADPGLAERLAESARALLRRGDALGAIGTLTRAAELSADPVDRSRRFAEAAYLGADAAAEAATARRLLGEAGRSGALHSPAGAAAAAHLLINSGGDVTMAHRLLAGAIEAGDHRDETGLIEALLDLQLISHHVGTEQAWETCRRLVGRLTSPPPALLRMTATVFADPARATEDDVAALDALIDTVDTDEDPARVVRIGSAAVFTDRLPRLRRQLVRTRHGPAGRHLRALLQLGIDGFVAGRWDDAGQYADEGIALCAEHGLRFHHWQFHWVHALVAAGRGDVATARRLTDDMARWAVEHQAGGIASFAAQARALADLGAGDYEAAYDHATLVSPPGTLAPYRPAALWAALDLVEAGLCGGHRAEAVAHAAALREARLGSLSPRLRLLTAAATAMTVCDESVSERFEEALSGPAPARWPFDLARVRLAYGRWLRRTRSTGAARRQITLAHDTFAALGAVPWRDRAEGELRATGLTRQPVPELLTAQEREIAELACAGQTNKQIGQRLFLSHRTVGDHLYKIFPKLGVTSRAALRDALTAYDLRP